MASLSDLRDALQDALRSPLSSFYRDHYRGKGEFGVGFPRTREEWESLPLLSKADLVERPHASRTYLAHPPEWIRTSSGTTPGKPLIMPREQPPYRTEIAQRFGPLTSFMGFFYPYSVYDILRQPGMRYLQGDPARLDISARMAAEAEVDGLSGFPSLLSAFADHLRAHYDVSRIRAIYCMGDLISALQLAALKQRYPAARIVVSYSSTEMQGIPSLTPMTELPEYPNAMQAPADMDAEILDARGAPIRSAGIEGELVVSAFRPGIAFPLFRYKTGDKAMWIPGHEGLFTLLGRKDGDQVRFASGVFIRDEVERAVLAACGGEVADFEAEVTEEARGDAAVPKLRILLITNAPIDAAGAARAISERLFVNERRTYADAVRAGLCASLSCETASLEHGIARKRRRLVDLRHDPVHSRP